MLVIGQPLLASGGRWIEVKTQHFELYTQVDEPQALKALQNFEQARAFFLQTNFGSKLSEASVRILDLASETEYAPYLVKPGAYACYQRGQRGDYIVMRDLDPEALRHCGT